MRPPSQIGLAPVLLASLAVLIFCLPASAQDVEKTDEPRYRTTFEPAAMEQEVELVVEPRDVTGDKWQVRVAAAGDADDTQLLDPLPAWTVADHYGYEIVSEPIGKTKSAVILAALPGIQEEAPPSATQFQLVWVVEKRGDDLKWRRIDSAQYSTLDGGERFEFRTIDGEKRLVRLQRGDESIFCGSSSEDPVLFERYNPKRGRFEQSLDVARLSEEAEEASVRQPSDTFKPPRLSAWYQWFAASSDRRSPNRRGALIRPLELGDGKVETGWLEGAAKLGRGEFASAQVNDAVAMRSMRIVPGVGGSKKRYEAFARPTKILIGLSDGSRFVADLSAASYEDVKSGRGLLVELPEPTETRCVSVMILEAEAGKRISGQPAWARDTVAISEATPFSVLHGDSAADSAARIVGYIAGEESARTRQRVSEMALTLEEELVPEVNSAIESGTPLQRRRLIPLLATLPADAAVPLLVAFFEETDAEASEYRAIKRSLAAHRGAAAPGLVEYLQKNTPEANPKKYTDVLRLLGRVGSPEQLEVLLEGLGTGGRMLRNERIRALASGGRELVEPLVVHASKHVDTDAGYDALRALDLVGKRLHFDDQGTLPRQDLFVAMLEKTQKRRSLMRALQVAKFFQVDGFVERVAETFARHADALVRRTAVDALERYPSDKAREVICDALEDRSPDVRIAAVSALARRSDREEALDKVLAYVERERWRTGLQQAFRVLASIEGPRTDKAFERLFREEPNTSTALLAAQSLDRANRAVDPALAERLVRNPDVSLDMRLEMLDLLGIGDADAGEEFLLGLLASRGWEELAESARDREKLRDHVLLSLGRRRSDVAREQLLDLAKNAESKDTQQIALRALAFYADEELQSELESWRDEAEPRLREHIDDTVTMIERRRSLSAVQEEIDEVVEGEEEDKDESPNEDAASDTQPGSDEPAPGQQ